MALQIKYQRNLLYPGQKPGWSWYLDDPTGPLQDTAHAVALVQADGCELEYLRARFGQSIPWPRLIPFKGGMDPEDHRAKIRANFPETLGLNPRIVIWFGDTAKFIIANL